MNVDYIINCACFHTGNYDTPYLVILGQVVDLEPVGFILYALFCKVPLGKDLISNIGNAKYEYHALISAQKTHPHIVEQYFEDAPEVRLEWETVDSIIKLLRRDD